MPIHIGGFFLPHLDGFCHLSQDNLTQSIPSPANPWRQALHQQKNVFYSKPIFELFWENYSWDGQLGFASGYRRILTAIYIFWQTERELGLKSVLN